jgi:hypothetical protein
MAWNRGLNPRAGTMAWNHGHGTNVMDSWAENMGRNPGLGTIGWNYVLKP